MTRFNRADVGPDFESQVATYVGDLNAHEVQMEKVRAAEPGHEPYPAPWAPEHVRAAVREVGERRYESSFEVVEVDHEAVAKEKSARDFRAKQRELTEEVRRLESEAKAAISPEHGMTPAKRALSVLRTQEKLNVIFAKPEADFTDEEKAFLAERKENEKRVRAIHLRAAEMASEIEDLTEETVNDWKPGAFE